MIIRIKIQGFFLVCKLSKSCRVLLFGERRQEDITDRTSVEVLGMGAVISNEIHSILESKRVLEVFCVIISKMVRFRK